MRLLKCLPGGKYELTKDFIRDVPKYAILSHTWGPDHEEVTYGDLVNNTGKDKIGHEKIRFCAARTRYDGLKYFWVDSCCIDKSNFTELSEAINSMFRWYQNAARCYVYLTDVSAADVTGGRSPSDPASPFRTSRWFTRGWTLQELIAPQLVEFFARDGGRIGDKIYLKQTLREITGISLGALEGKHPTQFSVEERWSWVKTRQTTREEDLAYCLLGIFGIFMPLIYGEGKESSMRRLKQEVAKITDGDNASTMKQQKAKDPTWVVPFFRNDCFTGRESELEKVQKILSTDQRTARVALTGLGGIGKTQLALELVYRTKDDHKNCTVIWISAASMENLSHDYVCAAKELGIPNCEDTNTNVKKLVQEHLSSESAGQWLLMFDNADDIGMWLDRPPKEPKRLLDYLPQSRHGSIVFTTRDKKAAAKLAGRNIVEVLEMGKEDATALFWQYRKNEDAYGDPEVDDDPEDTADLLAQLTYLPLAIVQAASYLNGNNISAKEYLLLLKDQEEDVIELLSEDFEDELHYHDVLNPVAITWLVSFNQMQERDPLSAEYLSFMACVDPKNIPLSLLPPGASRKKEIDALGTLQAYSFVTKQSAGVGNVFLNIHRLVHLATRNWLRMEGLLSEWGSKVITRLNEALDNIKYANKAEWKVYVPHAYYTMKSNSGTEDEHVTLLFNYGKCLYYEGRYDEGEEPLKRVMDIFEEKDPDHPDALVCMRNLLSVYSYLGRLEEAADLGAQLVEKSKRVFGPSDPFTLGRMDTLALIYKRCDRLEEAEILEVQTTEMSKAELGDNHPLTLERMVALATTYRKQGKLQEAEAVDIEVMKKSPEYDPDVFSTLRRVSTLGTTFFNRGWWDMAEEVWLMVAERSWDDLGPDHSFTLGVMTDLAQVYEKQNRWEEQDKLELQVLELQKLSLGIDHPKTIRSMTTLTVTYARQKLWKKAEKMGEQVLEVNKTKLGVDHRSTLKNMFILGQVYEFLGRLEKTEELLAQVVEITTTKLGADHPDTLKAMNELASTREQIGWYARTERGAIHALETYRRVLGPSHWRTLRSMYCLAYIRRLRGGIADALALVEESLEGRRRIFGPEHPDTLECVAALEEWRLLL